MNTPAFSILLSLSERERHGYEILKDVEQSSRGRVKMGPAVLYTNLKRMLEAGLIVEVGRRSVDEDERRRYYRLSGKGRRELDAELQRMELALRVARQRRPRHAG